ncbi:hypothetical protein [Nocardioides conyzicola]|uniref:Uncharacterized protein n=1 Tax=Nocardioides conyzicola TaxID=1651781 RepID=A0ABP8WPF1_9ACTN
MKRVVIGAVVLLIAVSIGVWFVNWDPSPNQGWDTTCGDLLDMTSTQREAVMQKAGVERENASARATFYAGACAHSPEDRNYPIGNINP